MTTNCIFCQIVAKHAPADIKFENDQVLVFKDINPESTHHYLSTPKQHMESVLKLSTPDHQILLEKLIYTGKKVIQEQGGDVNDLTIGFHLPPFVTVEHLHLHLISPAVRKPKKWWFMSVEDAQERLRIITEKAAKQQLELIDGLYNKPI